VKGPSMKHVIIGVDTHKNTHAAVAIDAQGARLGSTTSPATRKGHHDLEVWASRFGHVKAFGIEGTGSFGAGLSRDLLAKGHDVRDVMRPNRQLRHLHGKSDSLDAESAARSVMNGQATAQAKAQTGSSEMIRHLKVARDSAVKAKSQAMITLKTLIVNAPADLRDTLDGAEGGSLWYAMWRRCGQEKSRPQRPPPRRPCPRSLGAGSRCMRK
ncbi:IS110 family transposase, partial [Roseovarius sp. D22-M7]|uniref:IS110 family transposase n=1 Tax=Roseovarius sp. D22-M7 TaxID=3127116 RepID=UPI00301054CB